MINVGLGATVLQRALSSDKQLDGIGTYTQQLINCYQEQNKPISQLVFNGLRRQIQWPDSVQTFPSNFIQSTLLATFFNCSFADKKNFLPNVDIFHATDHYIPKLKQIPIVATIMDAIPLSHPQWVTSKNRRLKNWLFAQSATWAQKYIAISESATEDLVKFFNIEREKITVIPLGVDQDYFVPLDENTRKNILNKYGLVNKKFFLFIGTMQPRKNLLRVISAFKSLSSDAQNEFPLVVAGRYGWDAEAEIAELKTLSEKKTAHWLNYISQLEKRVLLQSATALVFPSLYEGFGLPVLEAFASGLPVITSNSTSLPEVAGDAALLIDPFSVEQIKDAMNQITLSSTLSYALATKGLSRARQYTWETTAAKTWQVYESLL